MDYQQISKVTDTKVATLKVTYHYIKEDKKKYEWRNNMEKDFDFDKIGKVYSVFHTRRFL